MTVVSLPGLGPVGSLAGSPAVSAVVDALERALAEARAGNIRAVGLALVKTNGDISTEFASSDGNSHFLTAAIAYLHQRHINLKLGMSESVESREPA